MAIRHFDDEAAASAWLVSLGYTVPLTVKGTRALFSPERRAVAFVSVCRDGVSWTAGTLLSSESVSRAAARQYDATKRT